MTISDITKWFETQVEITLHNAMSKGIELNSKKLNKDDLETLKNVHCKKFRKYICDCLQNPNAFEKEI